MKSQAQKCGTQVPRTPPRLTFKGMPPSVPALQSRGLCRPGAPRGVHGPTATAAAQLSWAPTRRRAMGALPTCPALATYPSSRSRDSRHPREQSREPRARPFAPREPVPRPQAALRGHHDRAPFPPPSVVKLLGLRGGGGGGGVREAHASWCVSTSHDSDRSFHERVCPETFQPDTGSPPTVTRVPDVSRSFQKAKSVF